MLYCVALRRYLYCPEGTKYAGRFAVTHMNNWQHTSSYPAFVVSGAKLFSGCLSLLLAGSGQLVGTQLACRQQAL